MQRPIHSPATPQPTRKQSAAPIGRPSSQWPARLASIGVRVSPAAQRAGGDHLQAVEELEGGGDGEQDDPGGDDSGASVKTRSTGARRGDEDQAEVDMKATRAAVPSTRRVAPRPLAAADGVANATAAAADTPSGTMNVKAAALSAIWCAARALAVSEPASTVAVANTPHSSSIWVAAGRPRRARRAEQRQVEAEPVQHRAGAALGRASDDASKASM